METHPLRGTTRWLIYPLLALSAGCLPGLLMDLRDRDRILSSTFLLGTLGIAVACGLILSRRRWVGFLVAPMLGALGCVWVRYVLHTVGWSWAYVLSGIYPGLL